MTEANNLRGMFSTTEQTVARGGANQLNNTAQLTNVSTQVASSILKTVDSDLEKYQQLLQDSQQSHDAMDKLIADCYDLSVVEAEFIEQMDAEELDKMIRSQQSKRSRAKSKAMTMDNYTSMLIGAVAENLLRVKGGKPKSAVGFSGRTTELELTDEQLQQLAADQEELKKAIRNVQSKKSIAKSKADFDPTSERWQQLLNLEDQLKSLRVGGSSPVVVKAVEATKEIDEMLASVETDNLKAADAKALLEAIKQTLAK